MSPGQWAWTHLPLWLVLGRTIRWPIPKKHCCGWRNGFAVPGVGLPTVAPVARGTAHRLGVAGVAAVDPGRVLLSPLAGVGTAGLAQSLLVPGVGAFLERPGASGGVSWPGAGVRKPKCDRPGGGVRVPAAREVDPASWARHGALSAHGQHMGNPNFLAHFEGDGRPSGVDAVGPQPGTGGLPGVGHWWPSWRVSPSRTRAAVLALMAAVVVWLLLSRWGLAGRPGHNSRDSDVVYAGDVSTVFLRPVDPVEGNASAASTCGRCPAPARVPASTGSAAV